MSEPKKDDANTTKDPDCQKYVKPTLDKFPDFPKDKIKYLKLPPFNELTDEDRKSFLSRASIAFIIQTLLTFFLKYLQTTQCTAQTTPLHHTLLHLHMQQSPPPQDNSYQTNYQPYENHTLLHLHMQQSPPPQDNSYQTNYQPYENYLPDGKRCGNLDILLVVAFIFTYVSSYVEQNYPDEFEEYTKKKPLNSTYANLVSLSQGTMLAWVECFTGGGDVVMYTFGIIVVYFFVHALYSGFLGASYTKIRAILVCVVVCGGCGAGLYFTQPNHMSVYQGTGIAFGVCTLIIVLMNMMINGVGFPDSPIGFSGKLNIGIMKFMFMPLLCVTKCGWDFISFKVCKKEYELPKMFDICNGPSGTNCFTGCKGANGCNCVVSCQCPKLCKSCCSTNAEGGTCECCYENPDAQFEILVEEGEIQAQEGELKLQNKKNDELKDKK